MKFETLLPVKILTVYFWNMAFVVWKVSTSILKEHAACLYSKTGGLSSSEMLIIKYQIMWQHNPENNNQNWL